VFYDRKGTEMVTIQGDGDLKQDSIYEYTLQENQKVVGMHVMGNQYIILGLNVKIATLDKKA
jgi:hypothetical protein